MDVDELEKLNEQIEAANINIMMTILQKHSTFSLK
jgi:hypothetical protein